MTIKVWRYVDGRPGEQILWDTFTAFNKAQHSDRYVEVTLDLREYDMFMDIDPFWRDAGRYSFKRKNTESKPLTDRRLDLNL